MFFTDDAMRFWDDLCDQGHRPAPIGGSDDHKAGLDLGGFDSPIGDPTTLVYADSLGVDAILAGLRAGRTVVKLQGPADPMLELSSGTHVPEDSLDAEPGRRQRAGRRRPAGASVRPGPRPQALDAVPIAGDPFAHEFLVEPPAAGCSRVRAEVLVDGKPRAVTNHLWIAAPPTEAPTTGPETTGDDPTTGPEPTASTGSSEPRHRQRLGRREPAETGCGCRTDGPLSPVLAASLLALRRRRR